MTTIIKNQIVKQLARFTKNLSPSKISLKFLKGEGELRNLELNESFLADLLELPPFIRLTRAVCNKISAKIHWTRLKTDPIHLFLDCVEVEMEMTENVTEQEVHETSSKQSISTNPTNKEKSSEYGFVEKVVDGMLVSINSVVMAFKTATFRATFQMSHLSVHSTDANWEKASLRNTRIKDEQGKEVLTFKQITFGTLRVDADALYKSNEEEDSSCSSPLRLITSSAKINIVIKKKIQDCSVVSARLHVILDDILWVLTHAQLQAVAGFAKSVVQVVEKSKKLEPAPSMASDDSLNSSPTNADNFDHRYSTPAYTEQTPASLFQRENVKETSYRVTTGKIDIHLCDDTPIDKSFMDGNGQSGGSMQIVVNKLAFEHYPYHLAFTSRVHWSSHNEASLTRAQWVQELFSSYKKVMKKDEKKNKRKASQKSDVNASNTKHFRSTEDSRGNGKVSMDTTDASSKKRCPVYLYECAFVISCDEFIIMPVATNEKMSSVNVPFLCSEKKSLHLPSDMPALQFDYTLYFYPGQEDAKVPQPNLFCQLNPLHLTMDNITCIWFNRFMQSIRSGFMWAEELIAAQGAAPRHIDVRIQGLMPKLTLPCPSDTDAYYKQYRPQALQLQMSSFQVTNTRIGSEFKQCDLVNTLESFLRSKLYTESEVFPNDSRDVKPLPQVAWLNDFSICSGVENIERFLNGVKEDYSTNHTSVVWMLNTRQCWCDFVGVEEANGRPRPFIEPFPIRLCMCYPILGANQRATATIQHELQTEARQKSNGTQERLKPSCVPLHRSPSDPYCKQPRPYSQNSSTRSTPLSSPGFARVHKSRSATSVNIPVLASDLRNMPTTIAQPSRSSSLSASQSGSEGSCDSFFEDTGSGSAQSLSSKSYFTEEPMGKQPSSSSQISKTTPFVYNNGGAELMSDVSTEQGYEGTPSIVGNANNQKTECVLSILLYVPGLLAIKLDHFQFVFLMRLQESFLTLRDVLFADVEKFDVQRKKLAEKDRVISQETGTTGQGILLSVVSKGAEVVLLVPAPNGEQTDTHLEKDNEELPSDAEIKSENGRASVGGLSEEVGAGNDAVPASDNSETIRRVSKDSGKMLTSEVNEWPVVGHERLVRTSEDPVELGSVEQSGHIRSSSETSSTNTSIFGSEFSLHTGGSSSMASEKSYRAGRDVCTVTIHGTSFECLLTSDGDDFAFKLLASGCELKEGYQQNLEAFLAQKVKKESKETLHSSQNRGEIRLRYALGSTIDQSLEGAVENGVAHLLLSDVMVCILMSNLDGVLECVQDEVEIPPPFMPAVIDINDLNLTINSDTPLRLVSLPPTLPLNLHIDRGTITRSGNGDFEIHTTPLVTESVGISKEISEKFKMESNQMESRVATLRNENGRLLKELEMSKEAQECLENERDRLLVTVERLTDELVRSNREHDKMQEIVRQYPKT